MYSCGGQGHGTDTEFSPFSEQIDILNYIVNAPAVTQNRMVQISEMVKIDSNIERSHLKIMIFIAFSKIEWCNCTTRTTPCGGAGWNGEKGVK